jgi:hypothetical protein
MADAPVTVIQADPGDVRAFHTVSKQCQTCAKAMADAQNRASVLDMTPNEAAQLAAILRSNVDRTVTLTAKEINVVVGLLNAANDSAVFLPAHHPTGLCVTDLVSALLSAGNLLETAVKRTLSKETVQ